MTVRPPSRRYGVFVALLGFIAATSGAGTAQEQLAATSSGIVIEDAPSDSAGAKAGIKAGDVLLTYDAKPVSSPASLLAAEENTLGKTAIVVGIRRDGVPLGVTVPRGSLGLRPRPAMSGSVLALYEAGRSAERGKNTDEAIAKWRAAAETALNAGDTAGAAWMHGRAGELHEGQRRWTDACDAHGKARSLLESSDDAAARSRGLVALGRCAEGIPDPPAAQQWYEQAAEIDAAAGLQVWLARDFTMAGHVAIDRSDLVRAADFYTRSLRLYERFAPESTGQAGSFSNLGNVAYVRGDLTAADEFYRRALSIQDRVAPDSLPAATMLNNLGGVALDRGELDAAQQYYLRAFTIRQRLDPESMTVAAALNNLGQVAWNRGELAIAEEYHRKALALKERLAPNSLSMSATYNNLGNVLHSRGDTAAAAEYHRRSLRLREALAPGSIDVATSLNNLANALRVQGDLASAEQLHGRALAIREKLAPDSLSVSMSLQNLGDLARLRGDFTAAEAHYTRALDLKQRLAPRSLSVATGLNSLGMLAQLRGDTDAALDYFTRALTLREQLAPRSLDLASSLNNVGHVALAQRRFADALPLFTRAVDIVEAQRWHVRSTDARALLLVQHAEAYSGLLRTQVALDDLPAAFTTAERAHARSLLDILAEARADIREGVDGQLIERERRLQQQLNAKADRQSQILSGRHTDVQADAARRELDALLVEYQDVQSEIRLRSPRYAALTQPQPLDLQRIQHDVLDADTLLLEYMLGDESSYLFAVTRSTIRCFTLPARATIEQAARAVYQPLVARQAVRGETPNQRRMRIDTADVAYRVAAAALADMILAPAADLLPTRRLVIVADGALHYVPFAALPEPIDRSADAFARRDRTPAPLVVDHEIVNLASASIAAVLRQEFGDRPRADRLVAVLADPVFDPADARLKTAHAMTAPPAIPANVQNAVRDAGLLTDRGTLSRLPFTRDEADAILALAPAGQSTRALDFDANRATATGADLSRYRIVHLATHGLLDAEHPELSGVVLSLVDDRGAPRDGFVRLHEVYNLKWSADLVVLSACQTALGKEIRGEGLVGLTRGFMHAGAERVLASLWNINDAATAQFMKRFYQGLLAKQLRPAAALREAQIEMWKRTPTRAPYYWAAFVLQGDWR